MNEITRGSKVLVSGQAAEGRQAVGRRRVEPSRRARAALLLAAGACVAGADGTPATLPTPPDTRFQKVTLNDAPGEPIALLVLPDGRVLHTTRNGRVLLHNPTTGFNTVAGIVPVYQHDEEGLQGIAVDGDFEQNHWLYLYYSPPLDTPVDDPATPIVNEGDAPFLGTAADFARFNGVIRLSRFKFEGNQLVLSSEQPILDVPVDRGICCHLGGKIDFDASGNLYLSTGDDTNSFGSDGYAPIDEQPGRNPAFDAQRSAANTNDLRGKLLRIRVQPDGSYTIPEGNLFPPDTPLTRPEIYAMGLRNPFRFTIDRTTGDIYLADYSADSGTPDPERGPAGHAKWTIVREPGNYGWPYCGTPQLPYRDFDFATRISGAPFDCAAPVNESPNNTGLVQLPPVVQPEVYYASSLSPEFPELGSRGVGPMAGPAYHFDPASSSPNKWPRYFDGVPIFYEWARDTLFEFRLDQPGRIPQIRPLLASFVFENPIDMQFGPDGALYVLEYGDGYFAELPEAQLSRVDFVEDNFTPVAVASADVTSGLAPLTVQLSSAGTIDPDGDAIATFWDFDADGVVDSTEPDPSVTYDTNGSFNPTVRVVDSTGRAATASARIVVGNVPPVIEFVTPTPGEPFEFGQALSYEVVVTDNEPVNCAGVSVQYVLGHNTHGHPLSTALGCTGTFITQLDAGHAGADNLAAVLVATYTDVPSVAGVPSLTGSSAVVLIPTPPAEPPPAEPPPAEPPLALP